MNLAWLAAHCTTADFLNSPSKQAIAAINRPAVSRNPSIWVSLLVILACVEPPNYALIWSIFCINLFRILSCIGHIHRKSSA
jgi:hypothetical protein